jgi:hypothetical protein
MLFVGKRRTTDMSHVDGVDDGVGYGVLGESTSGTGVLGRGDNNGVHGISDNVGVHGESTNGWGVSGFSTTGYAVGGGSIIGKGVIGVSFIGDAVTGSSGSGIGVLGQSNNSIGVWGISANFGAVYGLTGSGTGLIGISTGNDDGVYTHSATGYAAYLDGRVRIRGPLEKPGGSFKIDHPLDPANKYLSHSFVESPDMKNVYDGVVVLDDKGEAEIELPDWFGALNKDFRYQLTAIGAPGPNLYIAEEISDGITTTNDSNRNSSANKNSKNNNSRFKIAGGTSDMKVSWQVTGIRKDPWANAHRIQVEEDKSAEEQGYYLYPDLYGKAAEKGISRLLFSTEEEEERKKQEQLLINDQNKLT